MIKKADIILTAVLIVIGLAMSYFFSFGTGAGQYLKVTADGRAYGTYELDQDNNVVVRQNGHTNKINIKDGVVSMSFSDCHGQDCIHQHAISNTGETIVCLPNKVILEIEGGESDYDTIAK